MIEEPTGTNTSPTTTPPIQAETANQPTPEAVSPVRLAELFALTEGLTKTGLLRKVIGIHWLTLPAVSPEHDAARANVTVRFNQGHLEIWVSLQHARSYVDNHRWTINQAGTTTSRHTRIGSFADAMGTFPPESETLEYTEDGRPYDLEKFHSHQLYPATTREIKPEELISPPKWLVEYVFSELEKQYGQLEPTTTAKPATIIDTTARRTEETLH